MNARLSEVCDVESILKKLDEKAKKCSDMTTEEIFSGLWVSPETVTVLLVELFHEKEPSEQLDNFLTTVKMKITTTLGSDPGFLRLPQEKRHYFLDIIQKQIEEQRSLLVKLFSEEKVLVSRKQLEELLKSFPDSRKYEPIEDIEGDVEAEFDSVNYLFSISSWYQTLKELLESSGEHLNLALAFSDVRMKKKGK